MNRHLLARRARPWRALAAALAAGALAAAPAPARAAAPGAAPPPRKEAPRPPSPAAAARTAAPAPAAVPLPPPPTAAAPQVDARGLAWLGAATGAWAGIDLGSSLALQLDYGVERTPASWQKGTLEYRVSFLLARPTEEVALTQTVIPPGTLQPVQVTSGTETTESWVVEVVPTARVRMPFQKVGLYAEGGVGLAQTIERREREEIFRGNTTATENVTGLVLRLGAGVSYDLSPRTRLLVQPLLLSLQLGPSYSAYMATVGLSYRL